MLFKLFLAFTIIPAVELYLLIEIGSQLGALPTLGIVLGTGFLGAYLARLEGLNTLLRVREAALEGRSPTDDLLDGALIVAAGLVLITPGFLTDLTGFLLLFPLTRYPIREWLKSRLRRHFTGDPPPDDDVII
ncbi:MAG: membrane protein FxsA, partial [Deltaproteobacteria bacterium]|nr:membrane protein FxsA [Deltaproteobacteria bacterium]